MAVLTFKNRETYIIKDDGVVLRGEDGAPALLTGVSALAAAGGRHEELRCGGRTGTECDGGGRGFAQSSLAVLRAGPVGGAAGAAAVQLEVGRLSFTMLTFSMHSISS